MPAVKSFSSERVIEGLKRGWQLLTFACLTEFPESSARIMIKSQNCDPHPVLAPLQTIP